jgi:glycosyltransferase involved in cell wall biosynthesis
MTFKKKTFFTIIIPTRERSDTLMYTLKNALSQDYDQFQVLVSDNASEDDTREKVSSINDSRLKYVNTGRRVSMSENWEFALNHVNMGWITVLGDDDAILPGTLGKVNNIINKTGTSAIRSNGCSYRWPGFNDSNYGSLSISLKRGYETRDSGQMLQKVLDGKIYYNELPLLYNGGFISFDLVKQAKSVTKKFFMSMTPDVYSAMVFSLLTKSYIYSHETLAINGASLHSGGTAVFETVKQKRSYDPAEKFWSEKNIPFHENLSLLKNGRPVKSIQIIIYETLLTEIDSKFQLDNDLASFKSNSELIVTNRWDDELNDVRDKVYTRDVYKRD